MSRGDDPSAADPHDSLEALRAALAGRYDLEAPIGHGGMAVVLRAQDRRHGRPVAIKAIRAGLLASGESADRFLREIRYAAQLGHPHILPLYDSGELPGPGGAALLFYVMPLVAGGSLRDLLRAEGRLPVGQAIRLVRAVGAALDYAHRRGILHRDIKPENILLQEGEPVVADFGVARGLCDACEPAGSVTAPGMAVGTPDYMSPEQASGDPVLDARSDQYALACVLYELLTGLPPFTGSGPRATMARHATEPPPPPRARRPELPAPVEQALLRALAKEPADRFATVAEFCEALVTPLSGLPDYASAAARRAIAVLPFTNASPDPDNEYVSDGLTEELIHALGAVEGLRVAPRSSVFAIKGRHQDVRAIGALLGVSIVLEGSVRRVADRFRVTAQLSDATDGRLLWSERFDREGRDILALEDELARSIVGTLRTQLGLVGDPGRRRAATSPRAFHLYLRGRHAWNQRTGAGMEQAVRYFEQAIAEDPGFALAYTGLADAYAQHVDYRNMPVAEGLGRARREARKAIELDDTLAEAHTSLAWVLFIHDWDWPAAEREFRRAIALDPRYASARQWYSWYLAALGRTREAILEGQRAVELDPTSVSIRRSCGWLYYYDRTPEAGVPYLQQALVMNPEQSDTYLNLAVLLTLARRVDEAGEAIQSCLDLSPDDAQALQTQAQIDLLRGREAAAHATWERFGALATERYVSPTNWARLALTLGRTDDAFHWLEQARAERRGWLTYLRVDPLFDPVRADPRFRALLEHLKLA
ncbi:MAG: protein kinase [Gemmatimonadales bacterium]|nr:protein kinase [Gemmatimonadota bacterium]MBK7352044.1 protein kinase [Gemmatimonadota bacterium]MBK7784919.1 protein kinase [Gemmatimonadota bacterium]MBK9066591.1 protein kinase [Gemmatimonadota bacterium]MBP6668124.1 protein kinase [Gemmatimonadales bacterium]